LPTSDAPLAKVVSLDELAVIAADHRRAGHQVVQAHGTFDLVHLGHVKHLEAARRHGDVLVVTLTADAFVMKGPGRPAFDQVRRAEMLAALAVVDHVAIDDHPDAVAAIDRIQPDVYAKGHDYASPADDVTGKIALEQAAVEAHGGHVVFTDELTFSSTALINRHLDPHAPRLRAHLDGLRASGGAAALHAILDRARDLSVLVIGDAIIDEYEHVSPLGKSSKASIVAMRHQRAEAFAGGVFATANHAASFCARVEVLTCLGDEHHALITGSLAANVTLTAVTRAGAPTTRKRRFVEPAGASARTLFEVYTFDDSPLPPAVQHDLDARLARALAEHDLVIVNDFGHGLLAASTIELLAGKARFLAVNTQSNAASRGFNPVHRYPRADLVCLDAEEARLAVADKHVRLDHLIRGALPAKLACDRFVVTDGGNGCLTHRRGEGVHAIPAVGGTLVDPVGAGDAFLAVTAPLVAAGAQLEQAGFLGNLAGARKAAIAGHARAVTRADLLKSIAGLLG
jgi:rfaE bifunctional protein nucleotidyltransferase chain/domain